MPKKLEKEPVPYSENLKSEYSRDQKVELVCSKCGEKFERRLRFVKEPFLCRKHQIEATAIERYGSIENMQTLNIAHGKETKKALYNDENFNNRKKAKETCLDRYGKESFTNIEKQKKTLKEKYGVENVSQIDGVSEKVKTTKLERYGDSSFNNLEKMKSTCIEKYGSENPGFIKATYVYRNLKFDSSWELYFHLDNPTAIRNTSKFFLYTVHNKELKYYPDFELNGKFIEIKGDQFFKDDKMICPYDETLNDTYEAKHQCMLKNNVKILKSNEMADIIKRVDSKFTSDFVRLFRVGIPFPYPNENFTEKSDMGLIRHFHKSIWEANKAGQLSPIDAWNQKKDFEKVALNRLKYAGSCKPKDILKGYSVMRINDKISVFKPTLAKKLIEKYLNDFNVIFDPFSGFSGRLIGTINCNKKYIGQDIHPLHIDESIEINKYKNGDAELKVQDILTDLNSKYDCLFTCPPYGGKEHWNKNSDEIEMSCDEWIDICLKKYKCKRYLFVVDKTEKYKDKIVEEIINKSHFGENKEHVLLFK